MTSFVLAQTAQPKSMERLKPAPKRPSMRRAINAACKDCIFDPVGGGNWRQQVEACATPSCPLFELRPVSVPRDTKEASTRCARGHDDALSGNGKASGGEP